MTIDRTRHQRHKPTGFTLIELLVVLMILGLLAGLVGRPNQLPDTMRIDPKCSSHHGDDRVPLDPRKLVVGVGQLVEEREALSVIALAAAVSGLARNVLPPLP